MLNAERIHVLMKLADPLGLIEIGRRVSATEVGQIRKDPTRSLDDRLATAERVKALWKEACAPVYAEEAMAFQELLDDRALSGLNPEAIEQGLRAVLEDPEQDIADLSSETFRNRILDTDPQCGLGGSMDRTVVDSRLNDLVRAIHVEIHAGQGSFLDQVERHRLPRRPDALSAYGDRLMKRLARAEDARSLPSYPVWKKSLENPKLTTADRNKLRHEWAARAIQFGIDFPTKSHFLAAKA